MPYLIGSLPHSSSQKTLRIVASDAALQDWSSCGLRAAWARFCVHERMGPSRKRATSAVSRSCICGLAVAGAMAWQRIAAADRIAEDGFRNRPPSCRHCAKHAQPPETYHTTWHEDLPVTVPLDQEAMDNGDSDGKYEK